MIIFEIQIRILVVAMSMTKFHSVTTKFHSVTVFVGVSVIVLISWSCVLKFEEKLCFAKHTTDSDNSIKEFGMSKS